MWIPKLVFLLTLGGGSPTSTQRQFFSQGLESTTKCLFLIAADIAVFFYFGLWMTSKRLLSVWGCHMRIVFYSILLWEDSSFYQPVSFLRKVIIPLVLSLMWFANVSCVVHLEVSIDQKASQVNTFHIFHIWFNVRGVDLPINLPLFPSILSKDKEQTTRGTWGGVGWGRGFLVIINDNNKNKI